MTNQSSPFHHHAGEIRARGIEMQRLVELEASAQQAPPTSDVAPQIDAAAASAEVTVDSKQRSLSLIARVGRSILGGAES